MLKNYKTEVPASRSIESIKATGKFWRQVHHEINGPTSNVVSIAFTLEMDGLKLPFRLQANLKNVYLWLKKNRPKAADKVLIAQAERVCWNNNMNGFTCS